MGPAGAGLLRFHVRNAWQILVTPLSFRIGVATVETTGFPQFKPRKAREPMYTCNENDTRTGAGRDDYLAFFGHQSEDDEHSRC